MLPLRLGDPASALPRACSRSGRRLPRGPGGQDHRLAVDRRCASGGPHTGGVGEVGSRSRPHLGAGRPIETTQSTGTHNGDGVGVGDRHHRLVHPPDRRPRHRVDSHELRTVNTLDRKHDHARTGDRSLCPSAFDGGWTALRHSSSPLTAATRTPAAWSLRFARRRSPPRLSRRAPSARRAQPSTKPNRSHPSARRRCQLRRLPSPQPSKGSTADPAMTVDTVTAGLVVPSDACVDDAVRPPTPHHSRPTSGPSREDPTAHPTSDRSPGHRHLLRAPPQSRPFPPGPD